MAPMKRNRKRPIPRYIIIKMAKFQDKERTLKVAREKQEIKCKGAPKRLTADFLMETFQARRYWQGVCHVMKNKGLQPRLLYPARRPIKMEGQIRNFLDKRSFKEYNPSKSALQEMLKALL